MARNWQGMFNQMNRAIQANPLGGDVGAGLMTDLSQQAGGALGAATGRDPNSFMSQAAQQQQLEQQQFQAERQLSDPNLDLTTPEGLRKAAQLYQQMGDPAKALAFAEKAKQMEDAKRAKDSATLEAAGQGIQEEAARKKARSQKVQAMAIARRYNDQDALSALGSGTISPEAYLMKVMDKKNRENTTLADGAMLVGPNGEILQENPKDSPKGGDLTATMQKRVNENNDTYYEATSVANEYDNMLSRIDELDLGAGLFQTVETAFNNATGRRGEDDYFRTQAIKLKNHEAIQSLPKGPASDRDIAIVMRGFPADNAGKEEIKQFLEASSRVLKRES
jgi:hypothetical protein